MDDGDDGRAASHGDNALGLHCHAFPPTPTGSPSRPTPTAPVPKFSHWQEREWERIAAKAPMRCGALRAGPNAFSVSQKRKEEMKEQEAKRQRMVEEGQAQSLTGQQGFDAWGRRTEDCYG